MKQYLLIDIGGTFIKYSPMNRPGKSPAERFRHH